MKKLLTLGAVVAAAGFPGVAAAQDEPPTPKQNAAQACKAEQKAMGEETFAQTYGTNKNKKNAFGKCVSARKKEAKSEAKSAKQECKAAAKAIEDKAERKAARKACVKHEVKSEMKETTEERTSAADTCKKEQAADKEAFEAKYGTNANKRNAFGKCVSAQAKQQGSDDEDESGDDDSGEKPEKAEKPEKPSETEQPEEGEDS
ncbi:MAG TPA: hypothetical protein VF533_13870 [Solirubrobacteraceae bacterium]|jgi:hypothetical protein